MSVIARETPWATIHLAGLPIASFFIQQNYRINKNYADIISAVMTAGTFGVLSSPLAQLRFQKQLHLTKKAPPKSYSSIIKNIWNQEPNASPLRRLGFFFKGAKPRSITAMTSAFLINKGREYLESFNTIK